MTTAWYHFEAADVLFFRDGRPFNQGDPAQMAIRSLFPPHPTTAVGALRAALARGLGWGGAGPWGKDITGKYITETLGNGPDLKQAGLQFRGPYLVHGLAGPLFPAPAILVREVSGERRLRRLGPGAARMCDLRDDEHVRLAAPVDAKGKVKPVGGAWLTTEGMQRVLNGGVPARTEIYLAGEDEDDVEGCLFAREVRIGLARNARTRTAEQGALYTAGFIRPQAAGEGVGMIIAAHSEHALPQPASPIPFGGEGRFAWLETSDDHAVTLPQAPERFKTRNGRLLYTVTLITPAHLPDRWPRPGDPLPGLPGTIVCACHERPVMVGGWASRHFKQNGWGPQPLKAMLPAGSTWFLDVDDGEVDDAADAAIRKLNGTHIGDRQDWGYGEILIGTWQDEHAETAGGQR